MIQVRGLVKRYQMGGQPLEVLKGIDLDIPAGQFAAIMGPSGSGKSTLLHLIGGLDRPTGGTITIGGRRLDDLTSDALADFRGRTIGFIFQAFHLVPALNALENVALPGIFVGMAKEARDARAQMLLKRLGMADRAGHLITQLSGGQQQRIAIARSLFNNPPLIMGDEPTGALDRANRTLVLRDLRALAEQQHKTVIVVTHDDEIAQAADRVIRLSDGLIEEDRLL